MAWTDRLRAAAYTSPSGQRVEFSYGDVSRSVEARTTAYQSPDADGTYIQDLGRSGRQYPIRAIFWGADYDTEASAFEAALSERGVGRLDHPAYGRIDVVPFGAIKRTDALVSAANQATVEVTLWETIGAVYPTSQADPASGVLAAAEAATVAAAEEFATGIDTDTTVESTTVERDYGALLDSARDGLQTIADTQAAVGRRFRAIYRSVNQGLGTLTAQPAVLALQTQQLIQSPALSGANIGARLEAYVGLLSGIVSAPDAVVVPGYDSTAANKFRADNLYAIGYLLGQIASVVATQFPTKSAALAAADSILSQMDTLTEWQEANQASIGSVDTGVAYQALQSAVALTAGYLVYISFSLRQERSMVLDRARTIIDLVAELYGTVDDELDFFINSNELTGSEILEIPRGRRIVYYV